MGRFLQSDPNPGKIGIPETIFNKYSYVANNPICRIDPSGKFFIGALAWIGSVMLDIIRAAVVNGIWASAAEIIGTKIFGTKQGEVFNQVFSIQMNIFAFSYFTAGTLGGGVKSVSINSGLQTFIESNHAILGFDGAITLGNTALSGGKSMMDAASGYGTTFGAHELGHTIQFNLLNLITPPGHGAGDIAYALFGLLGIGKPGMWFESSASKIGDVFYVDPFIPDK